MLFKRKKEPLVRIVEWDVIERSGTFVALLEKEEDDLYVLYEVEVFYEWEPGSGDGLREPVYESSLFIHPPIVIGVDKELSEGEGKVRKGSTFNLTIGQQRILTELAIQHMESFDTYYNDEDRNDYWK